MRRTHSAPAGALVAAAAAPAHASVVQRHADNEALDDVWLREAVEHAANQQRADALPGTPTATDEVGPNAPRGLAIADAPTLAALAAASVHLRRGRMGTDA